MKFDHDTPKSTCFTTVKYIDTIIIIYMPQATFNKKPWATVLFLILLSGQVEVNPGDPMSGSLNLSSIFPCGYCEDPVTWEQRGICCDSCDVWFHKDCVDMGSFTFLANSTTNVSWICCRCNHPNFDRNLFHSFEIETTNNFDNLNFSGSERQFTEFRFRSHTAQ